MLIFCEGVEMTRITGFGAPEKRGNKYGAIKTYVESLDRAFDSKAEAKRAVELSLLERAGEIKNLTYQPQYVLCEKPKITYTADFKYTVKKEYLDTGSYANLIVVEDVKGVLTRETRVKLAWLREKHGITVKITGKEG